MSSTSNDNCNALPSVFAMALAQSVALLSLQWPRMNRTVAIMLVLLVPLTPLVAALVCLILGHWVAAGVLGSVFFLLLGMAMWTSNATLDSMPPASPEAVRALQYRANQTRVKRYKGYDVYLPPGPSTRIIQSALLLIPETYVDCISYAGIAGLLSDKGVLVAVQNTHPYRLPSTLVSSSLPELQRILFQVSKSCKIKEWSLGGHGMGTRPAAAFCHELNVSKLVLWGAYSINQDLHQTNNLSVLVVMASKDGYFMGKTKAEMAKFRSRLPPDASKMDGTAASDGSTIYCMVEGGNHAGFGTMDGCYVFDDGPRDITLSAQHKTCVNTTAMFLLHSSKSFRYEKMEEGESHDEEEENDKDEEADDKDEEANDEEKATDGAALE